MSFKTRLGAAWHGLVRNDAGWASREGGLELLRGAFARSKSGKFVNWDTALQVATVLAVVQRISFGVAQVPWKVYQTRPDGRGRDEARNHPLWAVLHRKPNPLQTSFSFRVTLMFHLLLTGNFYAWINRVGADRRIVELWPLEPQKVTPIRNPDMTMKYRIAQGGQTIELPSDQIWHIRGPSWNGWQGLEAVKYAREAIGLAMAAEETQVSLQKRGGRIPGVLSFEGSMTEKQYADISGWLKENSLAAFEDLGIVIADRAAKFQSAIMSGVDAQTIETRAHQREEICMSFGLFPFMIGHPANMAARASTEQIFIAHVVHTLDPWMVCIEQSADNALINDAKISNEFSRGALLRGAMKDQAEYFAKALGVGATGRGQWWMTQNEVRELIELNPLDGGDELSEPSQGQAPTQPQPGLT